VTAINTRLMALTDWLTMLGKLVGANQSDERMDSLAEIGAALAHDFGPDAFCSASAVAVARACLGFPTYGRVHDALRAWRVEHRATVPQGRAVAPPAMKALASPEADEAATWRDAARIEQRVAKLERDPSDTWRRAAAEVLLGCVKRHAPEHADRFTARLEAMIWPAAASRGAAPDEAGLPDQPGPSRGAVVRRLPEPPTIETRIALAQAALTRNPHDAVARMRLEGLRRFAARGGTAA
jgi:hypothetical protein